MILVKFNGKLACLSEHCRDLGLDLSTLYRRQKKTGDSYEKCLEYYQLYGTGYKGCLINFNGKLANIQEHCKDLGISPKTLWGRKHRTNETYEECLAFFAKYGTHHKERTIKDFRFWNIWYQMLQRCHNPKDSNYFRYGGRGITVCERWHKFEYFEVDMYKAYLWHVSRYGEKDTTIDRIKNHRSYMENNCRWATRREQAINRKQREGKMLMSTGETIAEFSKRTHISKNVIRHRLHDGWTEEEIVNIPIREQFDRIIAPTGENFNQLSERLGINIHTLQTRYKDGWDWERIMNTPVKPKSQIIILETGETIAELSKRTGIPRKLISSRYHHGWSVERIISTPIDKSRRNKKAKSDKN